MDILRIRQSELKSITDFINTNQLILHPRISPSGKLDFRTFKDRNFILLLDRNLLSYLITLVRSGRLADEKARISISSIMFWSLVNNVVLNSGFALMEYADWKKGNVEATEENNLFLKTFTFYSPQIWLDLALNRRHSIPSLEIKEIENHSFHVEVDHFKMHFLEMLKIAELFFDEGLSQQEKIINFYRWIYEEILICRYTIIYFPLLLRGKVKTFRKLKGDFDLLIRKCKNQAWDLTYLSLWSTFHYDEHLTDETYLFATMDQDLRTIFAISHRDTDDIYLEILGDKLGGAIVKELKSLKEKFLPRDFRPIESFDLDKKIQNQLSTVRKRWLKE